MNATISDLQPSANLRKTLLILAMFSLMILLAGCGVSRLITAPPVAYIPPAPSPPAPLIQPGAINSFTITVTQKTASDWAEICEDWLDLHEDDFVIEYPGVTGEDFCKWSITGFAPQGMISFQNYLDRVLFYIEQLEARSLGLEKMLRFLTEPPE